MWDDEAHVTPYLGPQTKTSSRVSSANAYAWRPGGPPPASSQGPSSPHPLSPATFRRVHRLRTPEQFRRVYAQGVVCRREGLAVHVAPAPGRRAGPAANRACLGLSIRRADVPTSVARNQWKRWIREAFRRGGAALVPGCDVVVTVDRTARARGGPDAEATLRNLLAQAYDTLRQRGPV